MTRVLVVEDDDTLRHMLTTSLELQGYEVDATGEAELGLVYAKHRTLDFVVLDLNLPGIDGHRALRKLRRFSDIPVIVVTVRDGQDDKIRALDAGADDYVTKPFNDAELHARVRAILRRRARTAHAEAALPSGAVVVDLEHGLVTRDRRPVRLSATEFRLLRLLVESDGRLLKHRDVLDELSLHSNEPMTAQTLRVYVARLRRKLGDDAGEPQLITTIHGIGYRWIAGDDEG